MRKFKIWKLNIWKLFGNLKFGTWKLNSRGFSLLELLLYIAILAMVSLFIANAFIALNRGRGQVEARSEVNSNLRFGIEKISQDIKAASAVTTPPCGGQYANCSLDPGNPSTTLVLTVGGQAVEYCVNAGQLRRQTVTACGPSSEVITSTKVTVSAPTFTRLENTNTVLSKTVISIEIDLTMSYNSTSPDYQYSSRKKTTTSLK